MARVVDDVTVDSLEGGCTVSSCFVTTPGETDSFFALSAETFGTDRTGEILARF